MQRTSAFWILLTVLSLASGCLGVTVQKSSDHSSCDCCKHHDDKTFFEAAIETGIEAAVD